MTHPGESLFSLISPILSAFSVVPNCSHKHPFPWLFLVSCHRATYTSNKFIGISILVRDNGAPVTYCNPTLLLKRTKLDGRLSSSQHFMLLSTGCLWLGGCNIYFQRFIRVFHLMAFALGWCSSVLGPSILSKQYWPILTSQARVLSLYQNMIYRSNCFIDDQ